MQYSHTGVENVLQKWRSSGSSTSHRANSSGDMLSRKIGNFQFRDCFWGLLTVVFKASIIYRVRCNIGNYDYTLKIEGSTPTAFKVWRRGSYRVPSAPHLISLLMQWWCITISIHMQPPWCLYWGQRNSRCLVSGENNDYSSVFRVSLMSYHGAHVYTPHTCHDLICYCSALLPSFELASVCLLPILTSL